MSGTDEQTGHFGVELLMAGMHEPRRWVDRLGPAALPDADHASLAPVPESERENLRTRLVAVLEDNKDRALAVVDLSGQQWIYGPGSLGPFQVVYFDE